MLRNAGGLRRRGCGCVRPRDAPNNSLTAGWSSGVASDACLNFLPSLPSIPSIHASHSHYSSHSSPSPRCLHGTFHLELARPPRLQPFSSSSIPNEECERECHDAASQKYLVSCWTGRQWPSPRAPVYVLAQSSHPAQGLRCAARLLTNPACNTH